MTITSVVQDRNGALQFRGLVANVIEYEAVWDPANVGSNSFASESMTIPGAALGDMVLVNVDVDLQNLTLFGHVKAADTVDIHLSNNTAGAVNLPSCNLHIIILQLNHLHQTP
jgi:hypothetical protein